MKIQGTTDLKTDMASLTHPIRRISKAGERTNLPGNQKDKQFSLGAGQIKFKLSKSPSEMASLHLAKIVKNVNDTKDRRKLHFAKNLQSLNAEEALKQNPKAGENEMNQTGRFRGNDASER